MAASNAGFYPCPKCLHDFPDKDPNYNTQTCLSCSLGSNFTARKITKAEEMYDCFSAVPKE